MSESRNAYRVLVGRPEGKRPLGRPRRRWEDNIKMDLREVVYDYRDWINLAQDRDQWRAYVRAAMNLRASAAYVTSPERFPKISTDKDFSHKVASLCWELFMARVTVAAKLNGGTPAIDFVSAAGLPPEFNYRSIVTELHRGRAFANYTEQQVFCSDLKQCVPYGLMSAGSENASLFFVSHSITGSLMMDLAAPSEMKRRARGGIFTRGPLHCHARRSELSPPHDNNKFAHNADI
ncbi:hypothetical protein ANN_21926 [Periplaneta americana]|uniref:Uncharacterized protein n=1 Tax=Periplaneta americana TaxID=6978 RepID=A0ABQ8S730_PERAM|nr:hypothetical protein ANN_21926 [Periplaneta americana]